MHTKACGKRTRPSPVYGQAVTVVNGPSVGKSAAGGVPVGCSVPLPRPMSQEAILEKVRSIVAEQLSVDAGEVKPESNFQNDLGADSLDTVELVMALEEAFDIEIPDEAAEGITTVGDAVKYIEEKQA